MDHPCSIAELGKRRATLPAWEGLEGDTTWTSTAEDDCESVVVPDDVSCHEGHVISSVIIGAEVPKTSVGMNADTTSSDCDSLAPLGDVATVIAVVNCTFAVATTSMVVVEASDCASGSDSGVDDHSIKLPVHFESSVCTCVS